jgi:hypothetical protein
MGVDLEGQAQGLLMTHLSLVQITLEPPKCPRLIEHFGFTAPIDFAVYAQCPASASAAPRSRQFPGIGNWPGTAVSIRWGQYGQSAYV